MSNQVFIVVRNYNDYDCSYSSNICAYLSEELAKTHAELANLRAEEIAQEFKNFKENDERKTHTSADLAKNMKEMMDFVKNNPKIHNFAVNPQYRKMMLERIAIQNRISEINKTRDDLFMSNQYDKEHSYSENVSYDYEALELKTA